MTGARNGSKRCQRWSLQRCTLEPRRNNVPCKLCTCSTVLYFWSRSHLQCIIQSNNRVLAAPRHAGRTSHTSLCSTECTAEGSAGWRFRSSPAQQQLRTTFPRSSDGESDAKGQPTARIAKQAQSSSNANLRAGVNESRCCPFRAEHEHLPLFPTWHFLMGLEMVMAFPYHE